MKGIFTMVVATIGILLFSSAANAAIKEGQWSVDMSIHVQGMDDQLAEAKKAMEGMSPEEKAMMEQMMGSGMGSDMGMKTTTTQCVTNENPVPDSKNDTNCKSTHTKEGDDTIKFEVMCDHSRSTGTVTYTNESMTGTIQSTSTLEGQENNVTIDITGQYVGPCA